MEEEAMSAEPPTIKRRRKPTITPKTVERKPKVEPSLAPGDTLEMSISIAVRIGGMEAWVRVGGNTEITADETASDAGVRLRGVVETQLDLSVKSLEEALS
jgi:hypothetical protein